jgi:uncharacterized protein (PEP-CTERM system associated)
MTPAASAALLLCCAAPVCVAQSGGNFTPTFSASTTYSDSVGRSSGGVDRQFVTEVSPGLSWSSSSGRLQGNAEYAFSARHYSRQSENKSFSNTLAASLAAEVIDGWFFVNASADIGQVPRSPFGVQAAEGSFLGESNRSEVASASISPYIQGSLAGLATYQLRLAATATRAEDAPESDSSSRLASLSLSSANSGAIFGWGLSATSQEVDFAQTEPTRTDRVNASLTMRPVSELTLGLSGGQESTDVIGLERRTYDNWGWSVRFVPTLRTELSLQSDRRYFGNSHSFVASHRMRRSTLRYTDTRGTTGGSSNPSGVGRPVTLFALFDALFTTQQPDTNLRRQLVLDFLRSIGREPGELVAGGLLTQSESVQRRQDLGLAVNLVRSTFSMQAFRSRIGAVDASAPGALGADVLQTGYTASLSHRLTPQSSLSLAGSRQMTKPSAGRPANDLKSASLSWSSQVSRMASTSVTARYSVFNSTAGGYREAALTASLSLRF